MKLNRRKTVLGLGAMATGSGAVFSSAAFQSSVSADADMRVVVDENLIARAGSLFGSLSADQYDDDGSIWLGKVSAAGSTTPSDVLFDAGTTVSAQGSGNTYTNVTDDSPGSSNRIPTPAAVANDGENEEFAFAIALGLDTQVTFSDLIEVQNLTQEDAEIGITFESFGTDASNVGGSPGGEKAVATEIYQFEGPSTDPISPDASSYPDPAGHETIPSGATDEINLVNNTGGGNGVKKSDITNVISGNNPDFGASFSGVNLVDTIRIGENS